MAPSEQLTPRLFAGVLVTVAVMGVVGCGSRFVADANPLSPQVIREAQHAVLSRLGSSIHYCEISVSHHEVHFTYLIGSRYRTLVFDETNGHLASRPGDLTTIFGASTCPLAASFNPSLPEQILERIRRRPGQATFEPIEVSFGIAGIEAFGTNHGHHEAFSLSRIGGVVQQDTLD